MLGLTEWGLSTAWRSLRTFLWSKAFLSSFSASPSAAGVQLDDNKCLVAFKAHTRSRVSDLGL